MSLAKTVRFLGTALTLTGAAGCGDAPGDEAEGPATATDQGNVETTGDTQTGPPPSGTIGTSNASSGGSTQGADATGSTSNVTSEPTTDPSDETAAATGGGENGGGTIDVSLSGCSVDFGGEIIVSYNGSLGVASLYDMGGTLTGSFQFELEGPATFTLSTQHRVDTGTVINMVDPAQGTWTNIDSDALTGGVDSIGGVLDVRVWEPARGRAFIDFSNVSLLNVVDGNVCTINGTVEADHL